MVLGAAPDDRQRPYVGVLLSTELALPVDVAIDAGVIGGPSAGLMFALSIIEVLGPDDLTAGAVVAGTGTLDRDGAVGAVGGIRQKILGATERADGGRRGQRVPRAARQRRGGTRHPGRPRRDRWCPVGTLDDALAALDALREGREPLRRARTRGRATPAASGSATRDSPARGRAPRGWPGRRALASLGRRPLTGRIRGRSRHRIIRGASRYSGHRHQRPVVGDLVRRRLGTLVVLGVLLVLFSANRIAVLVTDLWWFDARGYREVFTTVLFTRLGLGLAFGLFLAALIAANLMLARRLRPFYIPSTPQQAQIQRYRELADPYLPWLIGGVAAVFGFTSGVAVSAQWDTLPAVAQRRRGRAGRRAVRRRPRLLPVRPAVPELHPDLAVHLADPDGDAHRRCALPAGRHPARGRGREAAAGGPGPPVDPARRDPRGPRLGLLARPLPVADTRRAGRSPARPTPTSTPSCRRCTCCSASR